MHLALGPLVYWQDNARHHVPKCFGAPFPRSESSEAMAFDGVIVILSVVDILNDLASGAGERMCSLSAHKTHTPFLTSAPASERSTMQKFHLSRLATARLQN